MNKARSPEPEGFSEFWDIWRPRARHTDGRGLARDTFTKHVRAGANPQDIIDGARCFFRTMKDKDREFVPLSSTWMNRGAYEDMATLERAYQLRISATNQNATPASNIREQFIASELRRSERSFTR